MFERRARRTPSATPKIVAFDTGAARLGPRPSTIEYSGTNSPPPPTAVHEWSGVVAASMCSPTVAAHAGWVWVVWVVAHGTVANRALGMHIKRAIARGDRGGRAIAHAYSTQAKGSGSSHTHCVMTACPLPWTLDASNWASSHTSCGDRERSDDPAEESGHDEPPRVDVPVEQLHVEGVGAHGADGCCEKRYSCCLFSLRLYFFFDWPEECLGYGLVVIVPCLQVRPLVSHNEEKT